MKEERIIPQCNNVTFQEAVSWLKSVFRAHPDKYMKIIITNERKRTIPQNSWLHFVIKLIADFMRAEAKDQGNEDFWMIDEESTKRWIKEKFLGSEEVNGERRLRHTAKLTTIEMTSLWEDMQLYFSPRGLRLPDPNQTDFINDKIKTDRAD